MQGTAMRVGQNGKTFHPATSAPFKPRSQENTTTTTKLQKMSPKNNNLVI